MAILGLILLPFLSGEGEKSWKRRPIAVLTVLLIAITLGTFTRMAQFTPWSPHMNAWSGDPVPDRYIHGTTALERQGALVFQVKQCRNCHSLGDTGGQRGPALDSVAVRLTQDQLIRQVIQGGGNMPAYGNNLSPAETTALVAFLETLHPAGQASRARCVTRTGAWRQRPENVRRLNHRMQIDVTHAHHAAFESFWVSAALILAALVYLRGWLRVRRLDHDSVEGWRAGSFLLGLFFIWIAMASPLAALDHELLTVHMVQHLLLMTLAPPLILLGAPDEAASCMVYRSDSWNVIGQSFRSAANAATGQALIAHPAVCWLAAAATLVGWHIPSVFMLGMRSEMWHAIEQASFLATGLLFWWPVIQPRPSGFEMARVVDPLVSVSGYLAVRYSFRISCLLRSCGLPGLICPHRTRSASLLSKTSNAPVR